MYRWVKVGVVENRFEADRVTQNLSEAGIPFLLKKFEDTAYDGLFVLQKGWAVVFVPDEFLVDAERLIQEVKESFGGQMHDVEEPG